MSIAQMMKSDAEFDVKSTEQLIRDAVELPVSERARSLFALSKRVTVATVSQFAELLALEQNQMPLMFGSLPVRSAATIALLVNGSGEVRAEAERLWFTLSFIERHELKVQFEAEDVELPLLEGEMQTLEHGLDAAIGLLGPGEWAAQPASGCEAVLVKRRNPDKQAVLVDADGGVLDAAEFPSLWDAELAFCEGTRTPTT